MYFKRSALLCIILFALSSFSFGSPLNDFFDSSSTGSEEDCLALLGSNDMESSHVKSSHVGSAMKRGFWKCAKDIASLLQGNGHDIRNEIDLETRQIIKELTAIKTAIENAMPINVITPAFQWAQGPNDIFLNVKFAHKLDAPATLNVEVENITISNNSVTIRASDGKKAFQLSLEV